MWLLTWAAWWPPEPGPWPWPLDAQTVARVSCAAAAGPRCLDLVPVAAERCLVDLVRAAWSAIRGPRLVAAWCAQLLPVAVFVFVLPGRPCL